MSADNGIYILPSPVFDTNGIKVKTEYRVEYCTAIENIYYYDCDNKYEYLYFKNSKIFGTEEEALKEAARLYKEYPYLEYGICILNETDHEFPNQNKNFIR
ncbi:MAG: hypothetical protein WC188_03190 [Candidatus Caldatribacteriota bacterium]